jgi:fatty-acyl-CoA synthase
VPGSVFGHLYTGGRIVLLDRWDTEEVFQRAKSERANFINIATPKIGEIIETIEADRTVLESVRTIMRSGMSAPGDQVAALVSAIGDRYVTGWGMTENAGAFVTATSSADHQDLAVLTSAGRPVKETAVRVEGADDVSAEDGGVGELVVSSPSLMSGYWGRVEESAKALKDGWYRTGDLGRIDAGGFVHIVDRRTDLIVSGGMNIYPREVEHVILELPEVASCVVVSAPHPQWGRTPVAIVTARPGAVVTEADIIRQVRSQLASYKKPTAVLFRSDIPENLSGKVARAELGAWATEQLTPHPPSQP